MTNGRLGSCRNRWGQFAGALASMALSASVASAQLNGNANGNVNGTVNGNDNVNGTANGNDNLNGTVNGNDNLNGATNGNANLNSTAVLILSANPPADNPYLAGQQAFRDVLQTGTMSFLTQGIGAAGTPSTGDVTYSPISVTFDAPLSRTPTPGNITVSCTSGPCPSVMSVVGSGAGPYTIMLTGAIPPGACTTLTFAGTADGQGLQYQSLPGDTSMDGVSNTQDLLALIQALNNGTANEVANLPRYNVNRSVGAGNQVNTQDLLRVIQLLNGTNSTEPFNGVSVTACPALGGGNVNGNVNGNANDNLNGTVNGNDNVNGAVNGNTNVNGTVNGNDNLNGTVNGNTNVNGTVNGNANDNLNGTVNGNANDNLNGTVSGNTNVNGTVNGNSNANGNANGNVNGNANGNGNLNGNTSCTGFTGCPDGDYRVAATLSGSGPETGSAEYRLEPDRERFRVDVQEFAPGAYAVTINGLVVGTIVVGADGSGSLDYDTNDGTLPPTFPDVLCGDTVGVGGVLGPVVSVAFVPDCS